MCILRIALLILLLCPVFGADMIVPPNLVTHIITLQTVPSSPTDIFTTSVWLKAVDYFPQSTTSPTCTLQDKSGTPIVIHNAVVISPNKSYHDGHELAPIYMTGGVTWSCSDTTIKAQLTVAY